MKKVSGGAISLNIFSACDKESSKSILASGPQAKRVLEVILGEGDRGEKACEELGDKIPVDEVEAVVPLVSVVAVVVVVVVVVVVFGL